MASIFIVIAIMYLISNGTGIISALALLVLLGGGGILSFVFFIFWILGLIFMNSGKYEYGPIHSQKVIMALIFFILAIISYISGYIFILFYIFSGDPLSDFGSYISMMYIIQIISYFFTNMFTSLMWVFLIIQLAQQRIKILLWIFFVINITIFILASVITIAGVVWGPYIQNYIGGFGVIGNLILIFCYWRTYNRVRNREIMPIIPPFMPPPLYPLNYPPYFPSKYEPKLKTGPYNQPPK